MTTLTAEQKSLVQEKATAIRVSILKAVTAAKSGHPGGSLSIADLMALLYYVEMNVDPKNPKDGNRDRFVLSKGHAAPALYATLAEKGFFDKGELENLRKIDCMLQGHPDMKHTPGVDMSTGSLGQGISAACGDGIGRTHRQKKTIVFLPYSVTVNWKEGQVWEAAMFAGFYKLNNLTAFIDFNGLQIDGDIREVMSPLPIAPKFEAFNWNVIEVNGHDLDELHNAIEAAKACTDKPTAIVMNTVKGKGVKEMEGQAGWHGKAPSAEEYEKFVAELLEV